MAAFLFAGSAEAAELEGPLVQGGLVVGHTDPGATVSLDGKAVRVSSEGLFLLGFGRHAKAEATLRVEPPGGPVLTRILAIRTREWPEQRIDGLPDRKVNPDPVDRDRIEADRAGIAAVRRRDTPVAFFAAGFAMPLEGRVSGVFGSRRILNGEPRQPHNGLDIAAPAGTEVAAAGDGVVALARDDMFFTGNTVMIDHGHGLVTIYVHLERILTREGRSATKGEIIGTVGQSGRATAPHLHWGVSLFDTALDPALLVGRDEDPGTHRPSREKK